MSESNAPEAARDDEPMLFSALLTPHRSLGIAGFFVVMGLIAGISFIGGVLFFVLGAWPVIGFLGLDLVLIYWAFRANYLAAAAYEEVTVKHCELHVGKARARDARGIRAAAAVPGLARAQALHRGIPRAGRKRELCQCLIGRDRHRQAGRDA